MYGETKLFKKKLCDLYDYDINQSYELISKNTKYLENIAKNEIKDIMYSYDKKVLILLKNGTLFINGIVEKNNISNLWFSDATNIYGISSDNEIIPVIGIEQRISKYINNNNYKYKKVVYTVLAIAALTFEGTVRVITPCICVGILTERFSNVDDISIMTNINDPSDEDIVVKQNGKYWALFVF